MLHLYDAYILQAVESARALGSISLSFFLSLSFLVAATIAAVAALCSNEDFATGLIEYRR